MRALSRFASPETDEVLAEEAQQLSVAQLQRSARRHRRVATAETAAADRRRSLRWRWSRDGNELRLRGELAAPDGVVVAEALDRLARSAGKNPETGMFDSSESRCADALVQMSSQNLGADLSPNRATVVLHVDADVPASGSGSVELQDGPALTVESARRLACDGGCNWRSMDTTAGRSA